MCHTKWPTKTLWTDLSTTVWEPMCTVGFGGTMSESPLCCPAWDTWRQRDDKPPQRRVKKQALQDSSTVAAVSEMCFPVSLDISDCLEFLWICIYIYIYVCVCACLCVSSYTHIYIWIYKYKYIYIFTCIYVYKNQCTCPSMQGMCLCLVYHVCNTILTYCWLPSVVFFSLICTWTCKTNWK